MPFSASSLVLGVDGGGSRTRALLATHDGTVLGFGTAGPSNVNTVGLDRALDAFLAATRAAWKSAGLPFTPAASAFIGAAGLRAAGVCKALVERFVAAGAALDGCCGAGSDSEAALAAALAGRPGIVLLVGTGSFCLGRDGAGHRAECGGWGWLLDDVGGGAFLGLAAMKAAVRALDGRGAPTYLGPCIAAKTDLPSPRSLPAMIQQAQSLPTLLASLAPLVLEQAREGDRVANEILVQGATGLGELVAHVGHALHWNSPPSVVPSGGLGCSGPPYQPLIASAVERVLPGARIESPRVPTSGGALLSALELTGAFPSDDIIARLSDTCARFDLS